MFNQKTFVLFAAGLAAAAPAVSASSAAAERRLAETIQAIRSVQEETADCNLCGVGGTITIPDAILEIPGAEAPLTCAEAQAQAATLVPANLCPVAATLASDLCGCEGGEIPELGTCNVCGEGNTLTNPDGEIVVALLDPPTPLSCSELELVAGTLDEQLCSFLPGVTGEPCGCVDSDGAPVIVSECNICGEGNVITIPDGLISLPTGEVEGEASCQEVQELGGNLIPPDFCPFISALTAVPCGCAPEGEVEPPALSDAPSPIPGPDATDAPTAAPEASEPAPADGDDSASAAQSILLALGVVAGLFFTM